MKKSLALFASLALASLPQIARAQAAPAPTNDSGIEQVFEVYDSSLASPEVSGIDAFINTYSNKMSGPVADSIGWMLKELAKTSQVAVSSAPLGTGPSAIATAREKFRSTCVGQVTEPKFSLLIYYFPLGMKKPAVGEQVFFALGTQEEIADTVGHIKLGYASLVGYKTPSMVFGRVTAGCSSPEKMTGSVVLHANESPDRTTRPNYNGEYNSPYGSFSSQSEWDRLGNCALSGLEAASIANSVAARYQILTDSCVKGAAVIKSRTSLQDQLRSIKSGQPAGGSPASPAPSETPPSGCDPQDHSVKCYK